MRLGKLVSLAISLGSIACGGTTDPMMMMMQPPPPRDLSCTSTADCEANEACAIALDAGALKTQCKVVNGGAVGGQICAADGECRSGLCLDATCADPCGTCGPSMACETQRIERFEHSADVALCVFRVVKPSLELGPVATPIEGSVELTFDVPAELASFTVTLVDDDRLRVAVRSLVAPDGTSLIDIDDPAPDPNPATNYIGAAALMVPSTDDPRFAIAAGTWKMRVGTFDPANFGALDPVAGELEHVEVIFEPKAELGGRFDLTVHFSPGTQLSASTATSSDFVRDMLDRVDALLAQPTGIELGDLRYADLSADHDVVENGDETRLLCATEAAPGPHRASINVFLVQDLSYTSGHSGGIPLPPGLYGSPASGIVIESLGNGHDTGILLAHELGHSLGLRHTTEQDGRTDPVLDTPACGAGTQIENCPDYQNLMFPFFPLSDGLTLTPGQISVLRGNPALYEVGGE